jgi:hypothetical protein
MISAFPIDETIDFHDCVRMVFQIQYSLIKNLSINIKMTVKILDPLRNIGQVSLKDSAVKLFLRIALNEE